MSILTHVSQLSRPIEAVDKLEKYPQDILALDNDGYYSLKTIHQPLAEGESDERADYKSFITLTDFVTYAGKLPC